MRKLWGLERKKQLCWNHYRATSDPIDYAHFAQEWNKLRKLTWKLQKDYESHFANGIKRNPKAFWRYVNSKLKTRPSIESLKLDNGTDIYASSPITDISISDNVLFNKLQNLDTNKSPGPDG